jgi:ribosomal protein S18 acetylase RimI-like enzyme
MEVKPQSSQSRALAYREEVRAGDLSRVTDIAESTGFFAEHEVAVARELVEERLRKGEPSGYYFVFAEDGEQTLGYTCYGPIACTDHSYDVFWIVVSGAARGRGIGKKLMRYTEEKIKEMGGRNIYVETASKELYAPTRAFYRTCGYAEEARLKDFYAEGDDKIVFVKRM